MAKLRRRGSARDSALSLGDEPRKDPRGSRPGERRGPGRKGVPNRKTIIRLATLEAAVKGEGILPLDFMLRLMRVAAPKGLDGRDRAAFLSMQLDAAKAAAPYCHARKADVDSKNPDDRAAEVRKLVRKMKEKTNA